MKNQINEILESDIRDSLKVGRLRYLAREAFDRKLFELSDEYNTASDSIIQYNKPYTHLIPFSHSVFYANKPQVIILKEKHNDWVYDASTPENTARACLATIKRRLDEGYWYSDELEDSPATNQFDMFRPNAIPLTEVEQVEKILEVGRESNGLIVGGKQAFDFLLSRENHQYEDIEVCFANIAEFE